MDIEDGEGGIHRTTGGLPEGAEGSNTAGFLRVNLSRWISSLRGRDIEIRAHRVYDRRKNYDRSRILSSSVY